jgi:ferric-dicitrate binding protein FerR (iron transport regulator)
MTSLNASQRPIPAATADAPRRRVGRRSAAVVLGAVATIALGIVGSTAPASAAPASAVGASPTYITLTWPW